MTTSGKTQDQRALIQNALLKIDELRAKLRAYEAEKSEPIAIVGMGCRFPGGADNPEAFWKLLEKGQDAITEVPGERWDIDAWYDADPDAVGKMSTRYGGFLERVDEFDPMFFGISPREAASMDPQQRLLLEVAWEALEDANIPADRLYGSPTGVFIGIISQDYSQRLLTPQCVDRIDAYTGTGSSLGVAAGRLSYCFGLTGPGFSVDTACSSSLVTLHLACESLRRKECDLALTGGVNLMLEPGLSINFSKARMLAPDGRCKTFDAAADGYVRGEGCGVLVLQRLSDARGAGNRVLAVVRGSAVNQDGASGGLTVPSGPSQEQVVRQALANAGVSAGSVSYIEAHGTGTALGDPIELGSLDRVFGATRSGADPLYIGSVKTNVGHLEAAAGVAGVIKLVLALRHEFLPAHLHCQTPTPRFQWAEKPLRIVTGGQPWPRGEKPRIAGISSFGFSGTNAHVILEESPLPGKNERLKPEPAERHILALAARSKAALAALAGRYRDYLRANPEIAPADLCGTAATGRAHFPHRLSVVAASVTEFAENLDSFTEGKSPACLVSHSVEGETPPSLAFLFTGQGSQYPGMGRHLYRTQSVFREAIDRCADLLSSLCDLPLTELLFATEADRLDLTLYTQPALFCFEYALAELWRSRGVRPDAVLGHSIGEYVAACVAGVFSLEDGIRLIAARARLMQALPRGGAMATIFAPEAQVARTLARHGDRLSIAALNGPGNVVLSGDAGVLDRALAELRDDGIQYRRLNVSHAFHSSLMEPMLEEFEKIAAAVDYRSPEIPLVSNVTGAVVGDEITRPSYWVRHVRQPVRFADGIAALRGQGCQVFVEIGPNPVLSGLVRHCLPDDGVLVPSSRRGDDQQFIRAAADLFVHGVAIDWNAVYREQSWHQVTLPTYPYQRQRYWIDSVRDTTRPARGTIEHPLLGRRLQMPGLPRGEARYELDLDRGSFVRQHRVFQRAILPAAACLEMGLAAAGRTMGDKTPVLQNVTIQRALVLAEDREQTIHTVLTPGSPIARFEIYGLNEDNAELTPWTMHATGEISHTVSSPVHLLRTNLEATRAEFGNEIDIAAFYQLCRERGLDYGPDFQVLRRLWRANGQALCLAQLPDRMADSAKHYHVHPVLLDACLQVLLATLPESSQNETWLPVGLKRFQLYRSPGTQLWCHARFQGVEESGTFLADLSLLDPNGEIIGVIEQLRARKADPAIPLGDKPDLESWLYGVDWRAQGLFDPRANAALLPSPAEAGEDLRGLMAGLVDQFSLNEYGQPLDELDSLCVAYVQAAFRDMGHVFRPGERFSTLELAERLAVVDAHQSLLNRMLVMLAEEGILQGNQSGWRVIRSADARNPDTAWQSLRSRYPRIEVELDLTGRCGSALAEVLQGRCDPVPELLFPRGDGSTLAALYRRTPWARVLNTALRQGLMSAVGRLPPRSGVRIVEIGAGTGGTSASLLPQLTASRTEYVFTDISSAFMRQAEALFADYDFVRYQTLDIEKDPEAQGFGLHGYDIVVASNVLHATEDLARTLRHARQLLAPGGMMFLVEGTAPSRWVDLVFGMTSGWWRFRDKQLRPSYPLLSARQWCEVLNRNGFQQATSAECVPIRHSVIMARADATPKEDGKPEHWLIFADSGGTAGRLSEALHTAGSTCTLVHPGTRYTRTTDGSLTMDPYRAEHYQRLIAELGPIRHCVHLWSLDATTQNGDPASLATASRPGWESSLLLVQALAKARVVPRLVLMTRGAVSVSGEAVPGLAASPLWGMGKSIALEHPELHCLMIDLAPEPQPDEVSAIIAELSREISPQTEDQVALRGGYRYVARLTRRGAQPDAAVLPQTEICALTVPPAGTIDGLAWQPAERRTPDAGEVEVQVHSAGLNFKDVLLALHMIPAAGSVLGADCAGEVVRTGAGVTTLSVGDNVLAMAPGSFASHVTVPAHAVARLPAGLGFEAAATIPVAFLTALYALKELANLRAGERVLIHAASGGVGQAAIQVAQAAGAEIFATAGESKWGVLHGLGVAHVMNSRSPDFEDDVRRLTKGEGVDVVLNSLSGEFAARSLALLRPGGRFVELGIRDVRAPHEAAALASGVRYEAFDLLEIYREQPELIRRLLAQIMAAIESGLFRPLPLTVFPMRAARQAFRLMQRAKHTGKLVLSLTQPAAPRFHRNATYLISGGLGGLGLLVAQWMAERGAGHLALASRRHVSPDVEQRIQAIEQAGADVTVFQTDISNAGQVAQLFADLKQKSSSLRGIIHAAGVLDDGVLLEQTTERFAKVLAPKVDGAWYLHEQTQTLPLDFFILFSSATSLLGSVGQSNHVSANAFLDALAHDRRAKGLPGLSINWGAWSEIGYAARVRASDFLQTLGLGSISPTQGLAALERVFRSDEAQVGVVPIDWPTYQRRAAPSPYLLEFSAAESVRQTERTAFREVLETTPAAEQHALLTNHVMSQIAAVLRFPASTVIDPKQGFFDMGMDSLTSVEFRNLLQTALGRALPSTLAFDFPNVSTLVDYLAGGVLSLAAPDPVGNGAGDDLKTLEQLSEAEAEATLLRELEVFEGRQLAS